MPFHVVGFTEDEFFESMGHISQQIIGALRQVFFNDLYEVARSPTERWARAVMEVRSLAAFEIRYLTSDEGGWPSEFEDCMELFYFNDAALEACESAGVRLSARSTVAEPPHGAGILVRLPRYVRIVADRASRQP